MVSLQLSSSNWDGIEIKKFQFFFYIILDMSSLKKSTWNEMKFYFQSWIVTLCVLLFLLLLFYIEKKNITKGNNFVIFFFLPFLRFTVHMQMVMVDLLIKHHWTFQSKYYISIVNGKLHSMILRPLYLVYVRWIEYKCEFDH